MNPEILTAKKLLTRIIIALIILALVMLTCSMIGSQKLSPSQLLKKSDNPQFTNPDRQIFFNIRIPRIILAAVVGAALACAGVVFQALLRNPLADPYILGISSGAGLGVTIAVLSGINYTFMTMPAISLFAFIGAIATVWLVWFIAGFTGRRQVTAMLLAGVVVNAFFSAMIMFLSSIAKSQQLQSTIFWLMGNIQEQSFVALWIIAGIVLFGICGLFLIAPQLNILSFSNRDAQTIGINTTKIQLIAFAIASLITAIAVSISGLIGFVGLIIPHAVRLTFGPDHRQLIPLSAIISAAFLVIADTFARTIIAPAQLPVGIVTAVIGGPFFLILLVKYARKIGWYSK
ncbi:MAG: iron ABC transporter permease [Phycisphaerae bacterium]|nr:iron ABC transporter permease [Phycisphaerae bacterium]